LGTLMARCNRSELLAALGRYRQAIAGLERLVELEDWQGLEEALSDCRELRGGFLG
jgi:arogenate dehydrogenase (NADP+)